LRYKANPNAKDHMGNTPMHYAVFNESAKAVRLLDEMGGNAAIKNLDDVCPIETSIIEDIRDIKMYFNK